MTIRHLRHLAEVMEPGVLINTIALVVSILALVISAVFARGQIRSVQAANDTIIASDWLSRELISEDFITSEAYVLDTLASEHPADGGVSGLPLPARSHVLRVGRYYGSLGHLIMFHAIDETLILSIVHNRIWRAWTALEPYVKREREIRKAPFFAFFEHIAVRSSEIDVAEVHRKLGLRTFDRPDRVPNPPSGQLAAREHDATARSLDDEDRRQRS